MTLNVACYGLDEEQQAIDYLKNLEIEDLINVKVVLDEVFDVFDGLIKARKIKVATGAEQSTSRAPAVTTAITAQDIEAMGATDLDEVLETVPGLHVRLDGIRYRPIYAIRGISSTNSPEVLNLINGIPINNLAAGNHSPVWGGMPVNAISRIEIIRGPGSAVYGADAYSGVINIITKTKEDIKQTEVGTRIGRFNTKDAWILHGDQWNGINIAASLEYHDTEGQQELVEEDAQTQLDKLFGTEVSLAPGGVNTQRRNLDVRLDFSRGNWQLRTGYQKRRNLGSGTGLGSSLDPQGRWADDRYNIDLTYYNPTLDDWNVMAQISYLHTAWRPETNQWVFPPGAFGGAYPEGFIGNPGASEAHSRAEFSAFYSGFNRHLLRLGIGYHDASLYKVLETKNFGIDPATNQPLLPGSPVIDVADTPYTWLTEGTRRNWHFYLQDVWTFSPHWELTAGVRYDDYSDFGSTTNPRLALVWQIRPEFTSKLLYGRAFRAPSFNDLHSANNPNQKGNPRLKPETIDTYELAFDYRATKNLHFALNLFNYQATDKIQFAQNPNPQPDDPPLLAQNMGSQKGHGLELETRWKPTMMSSVLFNYAYAKATDGDTDQDVGEYPQHSAYVRTDWLLIDNWFLDLSTNWIGKRQRVAGDPRESLEDYTWVDLTLRYKDLSEKHWNVALGIRNLFDADAKEPSLGPDSNGMIGIPNDLPLAGRSYFLELRYQF